MSLTLSVIFFQGAVVVLGFELVSTETRDVFNYLVRPTAASPAASNVGWLRNLEQLVLSLAWLGYSIGLIMGMKGIAAQLGGRIPDAPWTASRIQLVCLTKLSL
jgi:hypothetical protein